jgi:hypothetical protein
VSFVALGDVEPEEDVAYARLVPTGRDRSSGDRRDGVTLCLGTAHVDAQV